MSEQNFAIVIISNDSAPEEVGLVPTKWLFDQERMCWWPPFKNASKVTRSIQEMWKPEEASWSSHSVRVLKKCCKSLIVLSCDIKYNRSLWYIIYSYHFSCFTNL